MSNDAACSSAGFLLLNEAGAAQFQAAVEQINATTCGATFVANGCEQGGPTTAAPFSFACVMGECSAWPYIDAAEPVEGTTDAGDAAGE